jgi:hypothetical protein
MGNYTYLTGKIAFDTKQNMQKFMEKYKQQMPDYGVDLFIKEKVFTMNYLHINPVSNCYKLLGYSDYFEAFLQFFIDNINLCAYVDLGGFEEDCGIFKFYCESTEYGRLYIGSTYDEESTIRFRKHHTRILNKIGEMKE